jgi:Replication-relaxation
MATQTQNRKQGAPQLRLTSAKIRTLDLLAEYFCLRTKDIAELIRARYPNDSDIRTARHTLNLLHLGGLVNRIPYLDLDLEGGGRTYAYGLSDKGVKFVKPLWPLAKTFDEHSQRTLDHELEISFFHIALKKFALKNGLKLYWQQSDLKHTVSPDAMFALTDPAKPEGKNTLYYFLEIERAKIGHYIKGEPSIMRKLAKYHEYYGTDLCQKEWLDFRQYRVIVVQRTAERIKNLLKELNGSLNHRMFWLTTEEAYKRDIGEPIFHTPKDFQDKSYSLLAA